jgi:hypothetical protein
MCINWLFTPRYGKWFQNTLQACSARRVPLKYSTSLLVFQMVFLPEACDYIGESKEETLGMAQPLSGDLIKTFCSLAKENDIWLSLGGIHEQVIYGVT